MCHLPWPPRCRRRRACYVRSDGYLTFPLHAFASPTSLIRSCLTCLFLALFGQGNDLAITHPPRWPRNNCLSVIGPRGTGFQIYLFWVFKTYFGGHLHIKDLFRVCPVIDPCVSRYECLELVCTHNLGFPSQVQVTGFTAPPPCMHFV